jgi:polysaccharide pyruvyl transferase WcaK-like protein
MIAEIWRARVGRWFRRSLMGIGGRLLVLFSALQRPVSGALLMPADDPGSVGDDAMVQAALQALRLRGVDRFGVVKRSRVANLSEYGTDVADEPRWTDFRGFLKLLRRYQEFYIFGADVMDGHYSTSQTRDLLICAQLARFSGRSSTILGFSFNNSPKPELPPYFRRLHPSVTLAARDPQSLSRFRSAVHRPCRGTADVAFLLQTSGSTSVTQKWEAWIEAQHGGGRRVLAVNLNPLIIRDYDDLVKGRFLHSFVRLATDLVERGSYSLLLVPHDYRTRHGDEALMKRFYDTLPPLIQRHAKLVDNRPNAAEIKELCGGLWAVISGRMHLCIAALGRCVPAFGVSYQDKFAGLFELVQPPPFPVVDVPACLDADGLVKTVGAFLANREQLADEIAARLPRVIELARSNFSPGA